MSDQQNVTTTMSHDDKNAISHVEAPDQDDIQKPPNADAVDEFGASTKTDPREIALVRKLDWHMMVGALISLD